MVRKADPSTGGRAGAAGPWVWKLGSAEGSSARTKRPPFDSTARAGNRRFRLLSALRAHTKAPHQTDLHRKARRALNRPRRARTEAGERASAAGRLALGGARRGVLEALLELAQQRRAARAALTRSSIKPSTRTTHCVSL
jgi:hypothetical protein